MKIELSKGVITNQELLQPTSTIIPQEIFRKIKNKQRIHIGQTRKQSNNCCIIDPIRLNIQLLQLAVFFNLLIP